MVASVTRIPGEGQTETLRKALMLWLAQETPLPFEHDVTAIFPDKALETDYRIVCRISGDLAQGRHVGTRRFQPVFTVFFYADNPNVTTLAASHWMERQLKGFRYVVGCGRWAEL